MIHPIRAGRSALLAVSCALVMSCAAEPDLVVYVSLDQVFSEELIREFERQTGLKVRAEYDTEASKTVGKVKQIIEESSHPRCDVYWNNEIAQTVRLAEMGLLQAYDSPSASEIPELFRDPDRRWTGFAARARCLIVNTDLVPDPSEIRSMWDLLDPRWAGKCGFARPLTGTTLTHATALYQVLGLDEADRFLRAIADGSRSDRPPVNVVSSNGQVMTLVRDGQLAWGFTDTDDFHVAKLQGAPVARVFPDQTPADGEEQPLGTLLVPNTVAILRGAPHLANAKTFVDWVLSEEVERKLAFSRSAQIPVRPNVERPEHVVDDFAVMQVSYTAIGAQIAHRTEYFKQMFLDN